MQRVITDKFGTELNVGDNVCFTLNMRKDTKPIVKARICEIIIGKKANPDGVYTDWIVVDYYDCLEVRWGALEKKLPKKVFPERVVKCY